MPVRNGLILVNGIGRALSRTVSVPEMAELHQIRLNHYGLCSGSITSIARRRCLGFIGVFSILVVESRPC